MAFIYDMADTWNAGGTTFTAIKMNVTNTASAAASKLLDLQIDSVSFFSVSKLGSVVGAGDLTFASGSLNSNTITSTDFVQCGRILLRASGQNTRITDSADGVIKLSDDANSSFNRVQFGGTTSAFPALKRSSAILQARLADDSAFTLIQGTYKHSANAVSDAALVSTHSIIVQDAAGTSYKVMLVTA